MAQIAAKIDTALATAGNAGARARIIGNAIQEAEAAFSPVVAAKTPSIGAESTRMHVGDATPTLITEGPRLPTTGELRPVSKTARAVRTAADDLPSGQMRLPVQQQQANAGGRGTNRTVISDISSKVTYESGKTKRIDLTGSVNGETASLGYIKADFNNGYVYVDMYEINSAYAGNNLSKNLFEAVIERAGRNANIFEGGPGHTNYSVLKATGDINQTPWAKTLKKLGYSTEYDSDYNLMTSTKTVK